MKYSIYLRSLENIIFFEEQVASVKKKNNKFYEE